MNTPAGCISEKAFAFNPSVDGRCSAAEPSERTGVPFCSSPFSWAGAGRRRLLRRPQAEELSFYLPNTLFFFRFFVFCRVTALAEKIPLWHCF
jgi:hypothetical protein